MQSKLDQVLNDAALPTLERHRGALLREWDRMAGPGPTLTGEQRVRAAHAARHAVVTGGPPPGADPLAAAAAWIRCDPGGITESYIAELEGQGLDRLVFAEVVAVVARLSAADAFTTGIGGELIPLPTPFHGAPTGRCNPSSALFNNWIPTLQERVGPTTVLRAIPTEQHAVMDIRDDFYLKRQEMKTNEFDRDLTRAEIELIAARCSFLNECVYGLLWHSRMLVRCMRPDGRPRLQSISSAEPTNPGFEDGLELLALTDAVHSENRTQLKIARQNLAHRSDAALSEAIAVAANFQMMARILTATGMDASELFPAIREKLGYAEGSAEMLGQHAQPIETSDHPSASHGSGKAASGPDASAPSA